MKLSLHRKYRIAMIFCIAAAILAAVYSASSAINARRFQRVRDAAVVASAQNFRERMLALGTLWGKIEADGRLDGSEAGELYVHASIAMNEMTKFEMNQDVRRAVRVHLHHTAELAQTLLRVPDSSDRTFEHLHTEASYGIAFGALFAQSDISASGELLCAPLPTRLLTDLLGVRAHTEHAEYLTYYLRETNKGKEKLALTQAAKVIGTAHESILKTAYSAASRIYYAGNVFVQISENGTELQSFLLYPRCTAPVSSDFLTDSQAIEQLTVYVEEYGLSDCYPISVLCRDGILYADFQNSDGIRARAGLDTVSGKIVFFHK